MSQEDLRSLLGALLPFAQQMLTERGSFSPFSGTVDQAGEIHGFAGKKEAENLPARELVDLLWTSLRETAQRGECRAAGVCCDVRVSREAGGEKLDAISIALESADGTALECYMPYAKAAGGELQYGELFGGLATPRIFLPATPDYS